MLRGLGWSVPALASVDVPDGDGLWRNARGNFCGGCGGRAPRIDGVCTCGAPDSDEDPEDSSSSDSSSSTNATDARGEGSESVEGSGSEESAEGVWDGEVDEGSFLRRRRRRYFSPYDGTPSGRWHTGYTPPPLPSLGETPPPVPHEPSPVITSAAVAEYYAYYGPWGPPVDNSHM